MMYCKNCGRQLKEGMRFCDRCGQSVRKSKQSSQAARHKEIEELKAERLNRKKRLAEKEARQAQKKKRKKKNSNPAVFFVVILLIAVVSVIIGYNMFPKEDNIGSGVTSTSSPAVNSSAPMAAATPAADNKSDYTEISVGNITVPYPTGFYTNPVTGNEKLNATDPLGGANMIVMQETKSGEPKDLMKEYITEIGADENSTMHAGSEWYSVTAAVQDKVYHRKCVVRNGIAVYYDFTYDTTSSAAKKYEKYISYIDSKIS